MISQFATLALWTVAIGGVIFALVNWRDRDRPWTNKPLSIGGLPGIAGILGAALFMLLLTGCATAPVEERIVEVKVPVAVQPIKPEQVPAVPAALPPRPDSLSAAADMLLGKWCEAVAYMLRADPLLKVSAGQPPSDPPRFPECERR